jgi:hypothetical protein
MRLKIAFSLFLALLLLPVRSQLRIGAEMRPRVLVDNGYSTPKPTGTPTLAYITQRTRLNTQFKGDLFETYISFQDVRFWGGDNNFKASGAYGSTVTIGVHQAWFMVKPATWISVKAGRQLFTYDDQRLLSSRNWNDYQVTYDAVMVKLEHEGHRVDLGLSWNAESASALYLPQQKFKTIDFIRYEQKQEQLSWSAIALITGNILSDTTDRLRLKATWGANLNYITEGFRGRASVYYQHHLNTYGGKVSAWCGSFRAGTPILPGRLGWSAGLDYLSGQQETGMVDGYDGISHTFDLLYGRRHAWYGYMDYFSTLPAQGLQDYVLQAEYLPAKKVTVQADYHLFWLAARKADPEQPGEALPGRLGDELDLVVNWKISGIAVLEAGYSFFITRPTLEIIKGTGGEAMKFPQFAYLMITLTPGITLGQ